MSNLPNNFASNAKPLNSALSALLLNQFRRIRAANKVPEADDLGSEFEPIAAQLTMNTEVSRRDATDLPMVTLDPASSTDLDQAFYVTHEVNGDNKDMVLFYAIADIGAFVARGSAIEAQAWKQGNTVYCPDGSVPLYPRSLSSKRASLLPDGPRPAILLTVVVNPLGIARLRNVERAMVKSQAKLAYETVEEQQLSVDMLELARRIATAELARGAARVDRPEQQIHPDSSTPDGLTIVFAPHLASEKYNAALSLATNLAVGHYFFEANIGLFRVMDDPNEHELKMLRSQAKALCIRWSADETLQNIVSRLSSTDQRDLAFAMAIRKTTGGARYMAWPFVLQDQITQTRNAQQKNRPWHSAIADTYAHATAPMRRLADRYVLDLLVAHFSNDQKQIDELQQTLIRLPSIMEQAERTAAKVDRESLEAIESSLLKPLIGQLLTATIIDISHDGLQVQIEKPAVIWRVGLKQAVDSKPPYDFGDSVNVRVVAVDPSIATEPNARRTSIPKTIDLVIET